MPRHIQPTIYLERINKRRRRSKPETLNPKPLMPRHIQPTIYLANRIGVQKIVSTVENALIRGDVVENALIKGGVVESTDGSRTVTVEVFDPTEPYTLNPKPSRERDVYPCSKKKQGGGPFSSL